MLNHLYENEFNLRVMRMSTGTHFEKQIQGNSEMGNLQSPTHVGLPCFCTGFCFSFLRMVISLVYYAVSFSAGNYGGNRYLVFFLISLVEFPSNWTCIFLCHK